ncbi:MAG: hypothetical protein QG552_2697, partial [Thermodesulfobacteriota bacterium]|nr:hypothetical protein [Thermodesulfobacteriota bacterium]
EAKSVSSGMPSFRLDGKAVLPISREVKIK